jgi:hypothetical protein
MAFVTSSLTVSVAPLRASNKVCAVRGSSAMRVTPARRAASVVTMVESAPEYPPSEVLGLGKEVPSTLYALASVPLFLLGVFSVYQSNIAHNLAYDTVNPQFIVGSLALPISWGCHVAAFIQKEAGK